MFLDSSETKNIQKYVYFLAFYSIPSQIGRLYLSKRSLLKPSVSKMSSFQSEKEKSAIFFQESNFSFKNLPISEPSV